jgi:GC-rich sequence DNA-binding factor
VSDIPSEASIKAAKERRERIRQGEGVQNEDEFIPLTIARKEDLYQGPHPESRLMREDDDLGEGDDGQ